MARVYRKGDYEYFDKFFNRFKKAVDRDDIIRTYCAKEFYEKPSAIRKRKKALAKKRWQKTLENERKELDLLRKNGPSKI